MLFNYNIWNSYESLTIQLFYFGSKCDHLFTLYFIRIPRPSRAGMTSDCA